MGSKLSFKFATLVIAFLAAGMWLASAAKKEAALWSVDLEKRYGLQTFDRPISARWTGQQGVAFLSPDKVLVYQVNRLREQRKLAPRSKSGGAGNFGLQIRVLDARDGHDLKQLDLSTNAMQSSVEPVNDNRFVVRTGDQMFLYSADFQRLAQKDLPLVRAASNETWTIAISPSGAEMAVIHAQIFYEPQLLMDGTVMNEGKAQTDIEILDPATLQTQKKFSLQHSLAFWTLLDGKFVSSDPAHSYSNGEVGTLDFEGHWKPIMTGFKIEHNGCSYRMAAVGPDAVALYGCDKLIGLTAEGQKLFSRDDGRTTFNSLIGKGDYVAVECNRYRVGRSTPEGGTYVQTVPDRIEVMRLPRFENVFSIPLKNERSYSAMSARGLLAEVDGSQLRVYGAGR
jgi:hypothetical protein